MKALIIEGSTDHLTYPLTLRMKVDRRQVGEMSIISPGKFIFVGELVRHRRRVTGVQIEVIADSDFTPTAIEGSLDTRRLAYQIEKLSVICAHSPDIPLYTPSWAS